MPSPDIQNAHIKAQARIILRTEFAEFFTTMQTSNDTWPAISDDMLTDAIAEALIAMGERRQMGHSLLASLVQKLSAHLPKPTSLN